MGKTTNAHVLQRQLYYKYAGRYVRTIAGRGKTKEEEEEPNCASGQQRGKGQ